MNETEKATSLAEFEAAIYPIWQSIDVKDREREDALSMEQVNAPGQVLFECATLHRQDLAIYASGIKPNRQAGDQALMADLRRRAARAGA